MRTQFLIFTCSHRRVDNLIFEECDWGQNHFVECFQEAKFFLVHTNLERKYHFHIDFPKISKDAAWKIIVFSKTIIFCN